MGFWQSSPVMFDGHLHRTPVLVVTHLPPVGQDDGRQRSSGFSQNSPEKK